jgi:hypothetical protein
MTIVLVMLNPPPETPPPVHPLQPVAEEVAAALGAGHLVTVGWASHVRVDGRCFVLVDLCVYRERALKPLENLAAFFGSTWAPVTEQLADVEARAREWAAGYVAASHAEVSRVA